MACAPISAPMRVHANRCGGMRTCRRHCTLRRALRRYATTTPRSRAIGHHERGNPARLPRAARLLFSATAIRERGTSPRPGACVKAGDLLTLAGRRSGRTAVPDDDAKRDACDLEAGTARPPRAPDEDSAACATVAGALRGRRDGARSETSRPPRDELAEYALKRRQLWLDGDLASRLGTVAGRRRAPGALAPAPA